ncbi:MAG: sigma-70 family RNA polymerase sigma factor [Ruminococcus sp.]|nr:sigma-70 family RNA polymerase sigma factor [Ruminococcus sp.]HRR77300.1 sigma-70 family RNA polymerase sigma factor [Ruminococcus sp.]
MTDSELRAYMKDTPALGRRALFDEYCNYVYAIVMNKLRSCGTREDIEECVSDAFADIYRALDKGSSMDQDLKSYIGVIAKRRAIDAYRRLAPASGRAVSIDDDESFREYAADTDVQKNAEVADRNSILIDKVKQLGEPDSTIIIQQYYYNRTASEIAKAISMTAAAVQKRSVRARSKLRELLLEAGVSL